MLSAREWIGLAAIGVAVTAINYAINNGTRSELSALRKDISDARAEFAAQGATMVALKDEFVRGRSELREDMAKNAAEMQRIVQAGLTERTDELSRAIVAGKVLDAYWLVRVANVPSESEVAAKLDLIAETYSGQSRTVGIVGQLNYEFVIPSLTQAPAADIQKVYEAAKGAGVDFNVYSDTMTIKP